MFQIHIRFKKSLCKEYRLCDRQGWVIYDNISSSNICITNIFVYIVQQHQPHLYYVVTL